MVTLPQPNPSRLFIDTSVLFAASHSQTGSARHLLLAGVHGQVTLVMSPFVAEEARRNLSRKSPRALPFFEAFLARGLVHSVEPPAELVRQVATIIVPKDAEIVAGAVHSGALFLASYDRRDLLSKRNEIFASFGVIVATPDEILSVVTSESTG